MKDNKHEFALFYPDLTLQNNVREFTVVDKTFIQRLLHVLRLKEGDQCIIFDHTMHAQVKLKDCSKKSCSFLVSSWHKNTVLKPQITALLPVLKRDAFESAIYSCAALGATTIQLIKTEKTRKWQGDKELDRLQRIVISASEQSKNFLFPVINAPVDLSKVLDLYKKVPNKLFADSKGLCFSDAFKKTNDKKKFLLFVGPEGDLTTQEKELLKQNFIFCKLTPTILKSEQALALMLGAIRMLT